jgi:YspA, cpYpsA-related SLOG family
LTRVLVCGDRNWKDREYIFDRLDEMRRLYGISDIIEGCARGADRIAEQYATARHLPLHHYPAKWNSYGKVAGIYRNGDMLRNGKPDMVIAFHTALQQSKGTAHMVKIAREAGIETFVFPHSHEGYRV